MRLKLTIINLGISSGVDKEAVFEHQGGVIGRKESNDWVLPDVKRFISSKHALIRFENNGFLLGDLSTNGIYLNNDTSPVGNGNFVRLNTGDQFKIGDYSIFVSVEDTPAISPDVPPIPEAFSKSNEHQSSNINVFPDDDVDPLNLLAASANESISSTDAAHRQASLDGAPVGHDFFQPPQFEPAKDEENIIPKNWAELSDAEQSSDAISGKQSQGSSNSNAVSEGELSDHISPNDNVRNEAVSEKEKLNPQLKAAPGVTSPGNRQLSDIAIKSFFKGIGIPPEALGHSDINNVMFDFGQVLRTTVQCLMEILSARANLKSEFRMNYTTIRVKENNPLKFSLSVDDALNNLFLKSGEDYLKPKEAVGEAVENLKDHQIALLAGMKAALEELVQQFDPAIVENDVEKYMDMSAKIPVYRKAKSWDLHCENYSEFVQGMGDNFQDMFGNAFTEAYEKQISELSLGRIKGKN